MKTLTLSGVRRILNEQYRGVLTEGSHRLVAHKSLILYHFNPKTFYLPGAVCARELRSVAIMNGIPYRGDHPDGKEDYSDTDTECIYLNDGPWSSDKPRTEGCLPLVLLCEHEARKGWRLRYRKAVVRALLSRALRAVAGYMLPSGQRTTILRAAERCRTSSGSGAVEAAHLSLRRKDEWLEDEDVVAGGDLEEASELTEAAYVMIIKFSDYDAGLAVVAAAQVPSLLDYPDAVLGLGVALLVASQRTLEPLADKAVLAACKKLDRLIPDPPDE